MQTVLPVDSKISEIHEKLKSSNQLVIVAPPGTGKTTRVPASLLTVTTQQIIVLEPRRLAARLSAERVAEELGSPIGETVGYRFRGEKKESTKTRLSYYTEGTFIRRAIQDPQLNDIEYVIIDEFHERHLSGDLALSIIKNLQESTRPDLKLILMSATLDLKSVQAFLPKSSLVEVKIPLHELKIDYYLESLVPNKIIQHAQSHTPKDSNILVFLPGKREINDWKNALSTGSHLSVFTLHGEMKKADQQEALSEKTKNKIILSTNIAESSLTIPGVRCVIDLGLARRADESALGLKTLRTVKISQSSAIQRAGRAARLGPGYCIRLYSKHDFDTRPYADKPEILRTDLTRTLLDLHGLMPNGFDPKNWPWFESPNSDQIRDSEAVLKSLGAVDLETHNLTAIGKWMLDLPFHPRHLKILIEAFRHRNAFPNVYLRLKTVTADSEGRSPEDRWFQNQAAIRALAEKSSLSTGPTFKSEHECESWCFLNGFSDRIQAEPTRPKTHGRIVIDDVQIQSDSKATAITKAGIQHTFPIDWLLDLDPSPVQEFKGWRYFPESKRVRLVETLQAGTWIIEEKEVDHSSVFASNDDQSMLNPFSILLREAVGIRTTPASWADLIEKLNPYTDTENLERSLVKKLIAIERLNHQVSGDRNSDLLNTDFPSYNPTVFFDWFTELGKSILSLSNLKDCDWNLFFQTDSFQFQKLFPDTVLLPSGRKAKIYYTLKEAPFVESRIQDFFGLHKTPTIAEGKLKLVVKLLAPNGRPQQVTQDLEGFWTRSYPEIRKELRARYPKHAWPEKP